LGTPGLIACKDYTPETMWVFYLSSEDVTISGHGSSTDPYYMFITDNCYASGQSYQPRRASSYNDENIPAYYIYATVQ